MKADGNSRVKPSIALERPNIRRPNNAIHSDKAVIIVFTMTGETKTRVVDVSPAHPAMQENSTTQCDDHDVHHGSQPEEYTEEDGGCIEAVLKPACNHTLTEVTLDTLDVTGLRVASEISPLNDVCLAVSFLREGKIFASTPLSCPLKVAIEKDEAHPNNISMEQSSTLSDPVKSEGIQQVVATWDIGNQGRSISMSFDNRSEESRFGASFSDVEVVVYLVNLGQSAKEEVVLAGTPIASGCLRIERNGSENFALCAIPLRKAHPEQIFPELNLKNPRFQEARSRKRSSPQKKQKRKGLAKLFGGRRKDHGPAVPRLPSLVVNDVYTLNEEGGGSLRCRIGYQQKELDSKELRREIYAVELEREENSKDSANDEPALASEPAPEPSEAFPKDVALVKAVSLNVTQDESLGAEPIHTDEPSTLFVEESEEKVEDTPSSQGQEDAQVRQGHENFAEEKKTDDEESGIDAYFRSATKELTDFAQATSTLLTGGTQLRKAGSLSKSNFLHHLESLLEPTAALETTLVGNQNEDESRTDDGGQTQDESKEKDEQEKTDSEDIDDLTVSRDDEIISSIMGCADVADTRAPDTSVTSPTRSDTPSPVDLSLERELSSRSPSAGELRTLHRQKMVRFRFARRRRIQSSDISKKMPTDPSSFVKKNDCSSTDVSVTGELNGGKISKTIDVSKEETCQPEVLAPAERRLAGALDLSPTRKDYTLHPPSSLPRNPREDSTSCVEKVNGANALDSTPTKQKLKLTEESNTKGGLWGKIFHTNSSSSLGTATKPFTTDHCNVSLGSDSKSIELDTLAHVSVTEVLHQAKEEPESPSDTQQRQVCDNPANAAVVEVDPESVEMKEESEDTPVNTSSEADSRSDENKEEAEPAPVKPEDLMTPEAVKIGEEFAPTFVESTNETEGTGFALLNMFNTPPRTNVATGPVQVDSKDVFLYTKDDDTFYTKETQTTNRRQDDELTLIPSPADVLLSETYHRCGTGRLADLGDAVLEEAQFCVGAKGRTREWDNATYTFDDPTFDPSLLSGEVKSVDNESAARSTPSKARALTPSQLSIKSSPRGVADFPRTTQQSKIENLSEAFTNFITCGLSTGAREEVPAELVRNGTDADSVDDLTLTTHEMQVEIEQYKEKVEGARKKAECLDENGEEIGEEAGHDVPVVFQPPEIDRQTESPAPSVGVSI